LTVPALVNALYKYIVVPELRLTVPPLATLSRLLKNGGFFEHLFDKSV